MRIKTHVGKSLWRGVCVSYPNALTYRIVSYTFDETRGYQLCHYDVVVAQLVATCFITSTRNYEVSSS